VHKVARETVTLDQLSDGRLTMGVGLGSGWTGELEPFGEVADARQCADLLDQGLARLAAYWAGEFEPRPVQQPRIPVWVAARWPNRRPVRRASRWDGLFAYDVSEPDQLASVAVTPTAASICAGPYRSMRLGPRSNDGQMILRPDLHVWDLASELRRKCGRYWDRTSDLFGVNEALSR
jgi:alkanesulfonate monooxygenase SsuD/methylene tetrahydromethanopterin reductase-like flavin-dependent oxidoreductase (luciferase family)